MNFKIINKLAILFIFSGLSNVATAASVGTGGISAAFSKNSTSVGVVLGSGSAYNDNYYILGGSIGYYVLKGLEIGVDGQYWFSGDPSIFKISPQIRYVFTQPKVIKPYVGVFYSHAFVDSDILSDRDSYGYRAGAYFSTDNRVYIGGGIVYEEDLDCPKGFDCSYTYPEILFQVSF